MPWLAGATAAECVVREGDEFSTLVRLGQVETLKESGSKAIGVRVFNGKARRQHLFERFLARRARPHGEIGAGACRRSLRKIRSEEFRRRRSWGRLPGDLDLYSADVYSLPGEERISYARRAEKAALDYDPRIKNSEGGSFDAATGHKSAGQLARIRRRIPAVVLLGGGGSDCAERERRHAARLLVLGGAQPGPAGIARACGQGRGPAHAAAAGGAQGRRRRMCRWCSIRWWRLRSSTTFSKA